MSRIVDLDAIAAEVATAEPIELRSNGATVLVHGEMPWRAAVAWDSNRIDEALTAIAVDATQVPVLRGALFAGEPSYREATRRLRAIWNTGESPAS